jgi:integrase
MLTQTTIDQYLKFKENSWAPTTLEMERYRLQGLLTVGELIASPGELYKTLKDKYKPYYLQVTFTRLSDFMTWGSKQLGWINPYSDFLKSNRNLFRNAYKSEELDVTYAEALKRIKGIEKPEIREAALDILHNGLRAHELNNIMGSHVIGKGGFLRPLMKEVKIGPRPDRFKLHYELKKVGLKPHSLRKLFATRLLDAGMSLQDVCKVCGWKSIETVLRYAQPKSTENLRASVKKALA